ncbi:MAG: ion channel [Bacteroidota bacterium]|nr:ion channel [Bacteroidota bacterium]
MKDALDKTAQEDTSLSDLSYQDRLKLSFRSYFEIIFNFAIIYFLFPSDYWKPKPPSTIIESVYFSGVTIVTLGYGDITPNHWIPQLLSVYEVFCGFVLIIVCFAVYVGKTQNRNATNA